jgi:hypothetical protein
MKNLTSVVIAFVLVLLLLWYQNINLRQANLSVNIKPTSIPTVLPTPFVHPKDLFQIIQLYRTNHGLPTYKTSETLCELASSRLPEYKAVPSHEGFFKAIQSGRYGKGAFAENLISLHGSDFTTFNAWIASPEHKENLDAPYTHSCLVSDGMYTVQEFGYY